MHVAAIVLFSSHCCMPGCRVVRYRSLEEEFTGSSCRSDALRQALTAEDTATNASLYILLRAVDQFHRKHRRCPGLYDQYALLNNMHASKHHCKLQPVKAMCNALPPGTVLHVALLKGCCSHRLDLAVAQWPSHLVRSSLLHAQVMYLCPADRLRA